MVIENITQTALNKGAGPAAPNGANRLLVETAAVQPKSINVDGQLSFVDGSTSTHAAFDIKHPQFGAVGDGVADDTVAFQRAADSGSLIFISPGVYLVDRVNLPFNGGSFVGSSMFRTIVRGRSPADDVFRWSHGGDVGDWRLDEGPGFHFSGFRIEINVGDTNFIQENFNRCAHDGFAVGPAGIAFERENFSDGNVDPGVGLADLPSNISIANMSFGTVGTATVHRASGVHFQGAVSGASIKNVHAVGVDTATTFGLPFARLVSNSVATNSFTVLNGTNPFKNGHRVLIRTHEASGAQPGGIDRNTVATVTSATPTSFQLSGVTLSSVGGGIYAMAVEDGVSDFVNADVFIGPLWHFKATYGIGMANAVSAELFAPRIYNAKTALSIGGIPSVGTSRSDSVRVANGHFPGPDAALSVDRFIDVDCDGFTVDGWLYTGSNVSGSPLVNLAGADHHVVSTIGKSGDLTGGANAPSLSIQSENAVAHGSHLQGAPFSVADSGELRGRIRRLGGSEDHLNNLSSWS